MDTESQTYKLLQPSSQSSSTDSLASDSARLVRSTRARLCSALAPDNFNKQLKQRPLTIILGALLLVTFILVSIAATVGVHLSLGGLPAYESLGSSLATPISTNKQLARPTLEGERTLVSYVYKETPDAKRNAEFFLKYGLTNSSDFVFVVNGEEDTVEWPEERENVRVIRRSDTCFDLGAHGEVLSANNSLLARSYDNFILMNASVRGPFIPHWSTQCWVSALTRLITSAVKMVGIQFNCVEGWSALDWVGLSSTSPGIDPSHGLRHIQAMFIATDAVGLGVMLPLLSECHNAYEEAVKTEILLTHAVFQAGYKVDALGARFSSSSSYQENCTDVDSANPNYGEWPNPMDHIFVKTKRGIDQGTLETYTRWYEGTPEGRSEELCAA